MQGHKVRSISGFVEKKISLLEKLVRPCVLAKIILAGYFPFDGPIFQQPIPY